ncbi:unnamed protein product, partial [marine sediment metagenome]
EWVIKILNNALKKIYLLKYFYYEILRRKCRILEKDGVPGRI